MRNEPVQIVNAEVPNIVAAVVMVLFLAVVAGWAAIICNHEPIMCSAGSVAAMLTDCDVRQ